MSRTYWKAREREAAEIIGGQRYPANTGGPIDCESEKYAAQVKEPKRLALAELEALALRIELAAREKQKRGLVLVKRSAGRGRETPWLVVMTAETFKQLTEGAHAQ